VNVGMKGAPSTVAEAVARPRGVKVGMAG